jgi:DNA mismatch repair protein MutL
LANQIAAGEVVERPASVVKELLENSLDAGAERIELELEKGGSKRIRVVDNGSGIHRDDLALAISPHATSKIYSQQELEAISSLGFRGEALASIASVSRFTLCSHPRGEEQGWQVSCDGKGGATAVTPCALPPGTSVEVRDLFFNIPARRKFLRSERTEYLHVEEVVKRLALSRFDVAFTLSHNRRQVLRLRPAEGERQQLRRVGEVLGRGFMQHALSIRFEAAGMRLHGWLAHPDYSRSQADSQYFYLNGRMVRDKLINHAVRQAHQAVLEAGRYPAFLLYLELDPHQVDINVHPTKHEVRFRESRMVHDFIHRALSRALSEEQAEAMEEPALAEIQHTMPATGEAVPAPTQRRQGFAVAARPSRSRVAEQVGFYRQAADAAAARRKPQKTEGPLGRAQVLLHERYLLTSAADGPLLVDLHQARQRLLHQRFRVMLEDGEVQSQPLLIPLTLETGEEAIERMGRGLDALLRLGFVVERLGADALVVREVPVLIRGAAVEHLMHQLIALLQQDPAAGSENLVEVLVQAVVETAPVHSLLEADRLLREIEGLPGQGHGLWRELPAVQLAQWLSDKT